MNEQDYSLWVSAHILATGANGTHLREVLDANFTTFQAMNATYGDLCEASERAIQAGNMKWPDEHVTAIVRELKAIREEQRRAKSAGTYGGGSYALQHPAGCDCPDCNGGEILPSYEAKSKDLKAARAKLQDYIVANGGTLQAEPLSGKKGRKKR